MYFLFSVNYTQGIRSYNYLKIIFDVNLEMLIVHVLALVRNIPA